MNKLFDLRFMIGLFFLVVGILLTIYGLASGDHENAAINWRCGLLFTVFGVVMICLSRKTI